jgi:hypothetical protein
MKGYVGLEVELHAVVISVVEGVFTLRPLYPGEEPQYSLDRRLVGHRAGLDTGQEKTPFPCPESNPGFSPV